MRDGPIRAAPSSCSSSASIRATRCFFAAFSDKVGLAVPWTRDHQQVPRAFDALRPGGYTAMFDAVKLIGPAFQRAEHARKVLLVDY